MKEICRWSGPCACRAQGVLLALTCGPVGLWFSAVEIKGAPPPALLHDPCVTELSAADAAGPRRFRIQAREGCFELAVRSMQRHSDVAAPFYAALPPVRVPRTTRLGWSVLLTVLHLPGADRWLRRPAP